MALNFPSLDAAIAEVEGFGKPGTPATLQNNPGNLIYNDTTKAWGATGSGIGGFAIFPDVATGQAAEDKNVSYYANKGYTLSDLFAAWAPASQAGNDPISYANTVAKSLGVDPSTKISDVGGIMNPDTGGAQTVSPTSPTTLTPGGQTTAASNSGGGSSSSAGGFAQNVSNALFGNQTDGVVAAFSYSRVGTFLLGLIALAGAVYLFKPVNEAVNTVASKAIKAAAV